MSFDTVDIIASIYEAAALPELWPGVLEQLATVAGAWGGALVSIDANKTTRLLTTRSYEPLYQEFLESGLEFNNSRTQRHIEARISGFSRDIDHCTIEELDADPLYTQLLKPRGLGWTMGSVVTMPSQDMLVFDFNKETEKGPFTPAEVASLDVFRPHLARAGLLTTRLRLERARQAVETLATIGLPGAVLTASGTVLAQNEPFNGLSERVAAGPGDRLWMRDGVALSLVRASLATIMDDGTQQPRSIPVAVTPDQPALVLHLVPLRRQALDIFTGAHCLLIVTPVLAPDAPLTEMLNGLFDLTPAEARLAKALASGATLATTAASFGVSPQTLKTQLKSVFEKTGVSRQADLVRLLAATSPLKSARTLSPPG